MRGDHCGFREPPQPKDHQPVTEQRTQSDYAYLISFQSRFNLDSMPTYSACFTAPTGCLASWKRSRIPIRLRRILTDSVGCAPFFSQLRAFSSSMFTADGSTRGLYQPMLSMIRPSRG